MSDTTELLIINRDRMGHVRDMFNQAGVDYFNSASHPNALLVDPMEEDTIERMLKAEKIDFEWATDPEF